MIALTTHKELFLPSLTNFSVRNTPPGMEDEPFPIFSPLLLKLDSFFKGQVYRLLKFFSELNIQRSTSPIKIIVNNYSSGKTRRIMLYDYAILK